MSAPVFGKLLPNPVSDVKSVVSNPLGALKAAALGPIKAVKSAISNPTSALESVPVPSLTGPKMVDPLKSSSSKSSPTPSSGPVTTLSSSGQAGAKAVGAVVSDSQTPANPLGPSGTLGAA